MISVRSWSIRDARRVSAVVAAGVLGLVLQALPAHADFKLCNTTSSRIGVAIGYQDAKGWATEGWWNLAAKSCETLLRGAPPSRYVYVFGVDYDRGGEWSGSSFMCTGDKSFQIRQVEDCEKRGFKRTGFMEVDTGGNRDWTVRFDDPAGGQPGR